MEEYGILCVGLACVDIVMETNTYPVEDSDQRVQSHRWQSGGNGSNNSVVLGILGAKPHFVGTIADSSERKFIEDELTGFGVNFQSAVVVPDAVTPLSYIIVSLNNGSRTILHHNENLRELSFSEFAALDLCRYTWIHFEGRSRNVDEMKRMLTHIHELNGTRKTQITTSVELEKGKPEFLELIPFADVIFVSKDFARFNGWKDVTETLENVSKLSKPKSTIICPWGSEGAGAKVGADGPIVLCPAFPPERVCDTIGAGDTFNASTIFALSIGESIENSITFGSKVAGLKVGLRGWKELKASLLKQDFVKDLNLKMKKYIKCD